MMRIWTMLMIAGLTLACTSTIEQPDGSTARFRWLSGELKAALPHSLPAADEATRAAFDELRLVAVDVRSGRLQVGLRARMSDGTGVRVKLEAAGTGHTFVHIKVGTIGDRPISLQILRHIQRQLEP